MYMEPVQVGLEWGVDIMIPVVFALQFHESFSQLVCWTFERPLKSLARRIQYMRPNDPYQFLRIKYSIMVPILVYIGILVTVFPLSRAFLQICLIQTLIIQSFKDLWLLRDDWMYLEPVPPKKITILDVPAKQKNKTICISKPINPYIATPQDPFQNVCFT